MHTQTAAKRLAATLTKTYSQKILFPLQLFWFRACCPMGSKKREYKHSVKNEI